MIVTNNGVAFLTQNFPVFKQIHDLYGEPPTWKRTPGFTSLCRIILEQQVSLSSANAHYNKLLDKIKILSPKNLLDLSKEEFKACYISKQKATYLQALSTVIQNGQFCLDELQMDSEQVAREKLLSVKGIGNWTADIYLLLCLEKENIFPLGHVALVNAAKELTGAKSKEEILQLSIQWQPHLSLASFYFWHYYLRKRNGEAIM